MAKIEGLLAYQAISKNETERLRTLYEFRSRPASSGRSGDRQTA